MRVLFAPFALLSAASLTPALHAMSNVRVLVALFTLRNFSDYGFLHTASGEKQKQNNKNKTRQQKQKLLQDERFVFGSDFHGFTDVVETISNIARGLRAADAASDPRQAWDLAGGGQRNLVRIYIYMKFGFFHA